MPRLNYSASLDDLEIMAGAINTKANVYFDDGDIVKAAYYYGAAAGIDQLLRLGRPEDAHFRVAFEWSQIEGRLNNGAE